MCHDLISQQSFVWQSATLLTFSHGVLN